MKKISVILLILVMLFAFAACKSDDTAVTDPTENTGSYEIDWNNLPDDELVGAWQPADSESDEYVLFTPDSKLRLVKGTVVTDADVKYGLDGNGNKSVYTQHNYLYGQWTYNITDGVLKVNYPLYEDGSELPTSYEEQVFNSIDYTAITLEADEDFTADEALTGKWLNNTYSDSYQFTEDGYVIYSQKVDDGVYLYDAEIKMTYNIKDGKLVWNYYNDNSGNLSTETVEYSIDGTKLLIGDSDYYLNGEGEPEGV